MARAIAAFDAVASDPEWLARPLAFPPESHPFNANEDLFYQGGRKLGARVAAAGAAERQALACECRDALFELIHQLRARVAADPRVAALETAHPPAARGADALIEAGGACFAAGFLEGGLARESQQDQDLGFGREMDSRWREAEQELSRRDHEGVAALAAAEARASLGLSEFLSAALPQDPCFNAGFPIGLFAHVGDPQRYPRGLPVMRSMNRHALGRIFQSGSIAVHLARSIGADLRPLIQSGMLGAENWERFTPYLGGFPSKPLMIAEARAVLEGLAALGEAQEIGASAAPASKSSAPGL